MKFIPPQLLEEDGQPAEGYTILGLINDGDGFGTILVVKEDEDAPERQRLEWITWGVRYEDGLCFHGNYMHQMDASTEQQAREDLVRRGRWSTLRRDQ